MIPVLPFLLVSGGVISSAFIIRRFFRHTSEAEAIEPNVNVEVEPNLLESIVLKSKNLDKKEIEGFNDLFHSFRRVQLQVYQKDPQPILSQYENLVDVLRYRFCSPEEYAKLMLKPPGKTQELQELLKNQKVKTLINEWDGFCIGNSQVNYVSSDELVDLLGGSINAFEDITKAGDRHDIPMPRYVCEINEVYEDLLVLKVRLIFLNKKCPQIYSMLGDYLYVDNMLGIIEFRTLCDLLDIDAQADRIFKWLDWCKSEETPVEAQNLMKSIQASQPKGPQASTSQQASISLIQLADPEVASIQSTSRLGLNFWSFCLIGVLTVVGGVFVFFKQKDHLKSLQNLSPNQQIQMIEKLTKKQNPSRSNVKIQCSLHK